MRPSNAVRTFWDAEAIDTSHLDFRPIQKIATIHASSGFIWEIPAALLRTADQPRSASGASVAFAPSAGILPFSTRRSFCGAPNTPDRAVGVIYGARPGGLVKEQ